MVIEITAILLLILLNGILSMSKIAGGHDRKIRLQQRAEAGNTGAQAAMDNFRSGKVRILVTPGISARGIDVSQISHVINDDLPDTAEIYIHRIGRTGRMAHRGTALSLVPEEDRPMIRTIEQLLGHPLERRKLALENTGSKAKELLHE
jgi:superfamily II DNA/RNA helicase